MPKIVWRLPEIVKREGIKPLQLVRVLEGKVAQPTVYRWLRGETVRFDAEPLAWAVWGVNRLTGKRYTVCDLLEYSED